MRPKPCKHEFKGAWGGKFRKCLVCGKGWYWWHCKSKWQRTPPGEVLGNAAALANRFIVGFSPYHQDRLVRYGEIRRDKYGVGSAHGGK